MLKQNKMFKVLVSNKFVKIYQLYQSFQNFEEYYCIVEAQ